MKGNLEFRKRAVEVFFALLYIAVCVVIGWVVREESSDFRILASLVNPVLLMVYLRWYIKRNPPFE